MTEALAQVEDTGEKFYEAELWRLKGQLTLQQSSVQRLESRVQSHKSKATDLQAEAKAEACFRQAIEIARRQGAKSLELRAVMSLSRLWQQEGKQKQAHQILTTVYNWFTEGLETGDLQKTKALLDARS